MLEKPDFPDESIIACLQGDYGLPAARVTFLPLGADLNTAVFRVVTEDGSAYFVKLRSGVFDETSVALPKFLSEQGIAQIIPPLATRTGRLWSDLGLFKLVLYPFVEGRDGYQVVLSERQWADFGAALKRLHTVAVPPALAACIRREDYTPRGRKIVRTFLQRIEHEVFEDSTAQKLAAFLKTKRAEIFDLVGRAERLALVLRHQPRNFVLCHYDAHAANILIDASGALYIVDWDNPIFAPKERDLMFPGGAQGFIGRSAQEEEALFYQGYGQTQIDPIALAYYRYERIVQDIAVFCEQLFLSDAGGEDREQSLHYLKSNFLPHNTIETAYRSDRTLMNS